MIRQIQKYNREFRRFRFRLGRFLTRSASVRRNERHGSFVKDGRAEIRSVLSSTPITLSRDRLTALRGTARNFAQNRVDVLGSGWVDTRPGVPARGFRGHNYSAAESTEYSGDYLAAHVNQSNVKYARSVWDLLDGEYVPIDWQRDFKSGFQWRSSAPSTEVQIGDVAGSDIKIPWELAKLQHLPQLAVAFAASGPESKTYQRAFRNQTLDFIAANPPGFGANWHTAMLAGIRCANLLVAFDLFRAHGALFSEAFQSVFYRSILDHARFIVANLDWWVDDQRNNHFIANVAGLAVICAYLPESDETNDMLCFVLRCLTSETEAQFNQDGGSVEGSTAYHAFSAEMIAWSIEFVESIPLDQRQRAVKRNGSTLPRFAQTVGWARIVIDTVDPSPRKCLQSRLNSIASFFEDSIDSDRRMVQIGDNDSGRFLKLAPSVEALTVEDAIDRYSSLEGYQMPNGETVYWDEDLLCYSGIGAVLESVCGARYDDYRDTAEYQVALSLQRIDSSSGKKRTGERTRVNRHGGRQNSNRVSVIREPPTVSIDDEGALHITRVLDGAEVHLRSYPQFGLYIYRSADFLLHVRCGGLLTLSSVGHPHEDQLAISLSVGGNSVITDPGTYVYTAAPAARRLYRGRCAHFVPGWTPARNTRTTALFDSLPALTAGLVHSVRHNRFTGSVKLDETVITRTVTILRNEIVIKDTTEGGKVVDLSTVLQKLSKLPPSAGYGKTRRSGSAIAAEVSLC